MDPDELLVVLWDRGMDSVTSPTDSLSASVLGQARSLLGLPSPGQLRRREYWQQRLGLTPNELETLLADHGLTLSRASRTLPKGAIKKLRHLDPADFGNTSVIPPAAPLPELEVMRAWEPLEWRIIGRRRESITYLSEEQVLSIHLLLVRDFATSGDPIDPPGARSSDLLGAAVFRPHTSLGSEMKYPTPEMASAAVLHAIVNDHPFFNGNKRTGVVSMLVMLYENDLRLTCPQDDLFKKVLQTAQHRLVSKGVPDRDDREVLALAQWIRDNSAPVERGERVVKWLKLKRILSRYGVQWTHPGGVGNRIDLTREYETTQGYIRRRTETAILQTQVAFQNDGADVPRNTVTKIRRDLHLDETHGIDSHMFYESGDMPEDFIVEYQQTLARLARL